MAVGNGERSSGALSILRLTTWAALGLSAFPIAALLGQTPSSAEPAVHEAYLNVPGARIFYRDTGGSGVPVVLLHAATGSSRVWEYQIPAFTGAGYRVIAFDRRGWGRTEISAGESQPGTAADDLLALLDQLKLDRVRGRSLRRARFCSLVPKAFAQPGVCKLHRGRARPRLYPIGYSPSSPAI